MKFSSFAVVVVGSRYNAMDFGKFSVRCSFEQKTSIHKYLSVMYILLRTGTGFDVMRDLLKIESGKRTWPSFESLRKGRKSLKQNRCLQAKLNYPRKFYFLLREQPLVRYG